MIVVEHGVQVVLHFLKPLLAPVGADPNKESNSNGKAAAH
jgi:hypothetical protein